MRRMVLVLCGCLGAAPLAWADMPEQRVETLTQEVQQLRQMVEQLQSTVHAQQQRLAELERANTQPRLTVGAPPATAVPSGGSGGANLSAFNPEIGVVADVVGKLLESSLDGGGNDKLSVRETELVFGSAINPYSRFDSTITFSDTESPDIEEAYITYWGLPAEIKAKLGRMRPKVGKASAIHGDQLDTVDEPLVVSKYLGREGLFRTGLEFTGFIPAPWTAVTHELTVGTMEGGVGDEGTLFGSARRRPSFYAHLKNFWDISDTSNLELGTTYLVGSKDADARFEVNALGLDATLTHYVTPANKLKWQNEVYLQDRKESFSIADDGTRTKFEKRPWGFYSLLDYRLSPRLGIGGRVDYVQPIDLNLVASPRNADTAWSGYLTLYQSEFSRWRLQFRHTDFAAGGDDNTIFAQGTVAIGVHKHQLQ